MDRKPVSVLKTAVCILLCLAIIIGGLAALTNITQRKDSVTKYTKFFENAQDYDILYLGTSHVINAFLPMELWGEYGMTAYNLGGHSNTMAINYWVLKNALDYASPKLVVLDCFDISGDTRCNDTFFAHFSLDALPLSKNKVSAVYDIFSEPDLIPLRSDFLFRFSIYHTRWEELSADDFSAGDGIENGANSRIGLAAPASFAPTDATAEVASGNVGLSYFDRILAECESRGIDVLLTYLPYPAPEERWMEANYVQTLAQERGLDYINFLKLGVIDYNTDCYDSASHLNPSGAKKVTHYLGKYIREHYDITDRRGESAYAHWSNDYQRYLGINASQPLGQNDLYIWLMLLSDSYFDCCIYIAPQSTLLADKTVRSLIFNLGKAQSGIDGSALESGSACLIVKENGVLKICAVPEDEPLAAVTARGTFSIEQRGSETSLCLDGEDIYDAADSVDAIVSYTAGDVTRTVGFAASESRYLVLE